MTTKTEKRKPIYNLWESAPMNLRWRMVGVMMACLLSISCGGDGARGSGVTSVALVDQFAIDGVVDFSGLPNVQTTSVTFKDWGGGTPVKPSTVTWAITNDDRDVYFAVQWTDDTSNNTYELGTGPTDFDGAQLLIDNDGDGTYETGEDKRMVIAESVGSQYIDQHNSTDDETDSTGDGQAKLSYNATTRTYQAEFLFPMAADENGEDADLTASSRYNIQLWDHIELATPDGNLAQLNEQLTNSSTWSTVPVIASPAISRAEIPTGLTGLIAFISDHENVNGDVYTFDPATGSVFRVTNDTLYKDGVSLSHNRTRIAYFASTGQTDYTSYEIYAVNTDGTGLTQLTSNSVTDGHPGWSPDDSTIVYASLRTGNKASIVTMTAEGTEIAVLTPLGIDDNDPDYLPDGRIIFKTDRFQTVPQVQIAVMNADGTGVQQVSFETGVSDHDPVGDSRFAYFERYMRPTNYATDVEAGFTSWNIIEARVDGAGESTLVEDGWVNWLPVLDPTGNYIAYLKSVGYTEVRLMTRSGSDVGRLVPRLTRMTYLDWK